MIQGVRCKKLKFRVSILGHLESQTCGMRPGLWNSRHVAWQAGPTTWRRGPGPGAWDMKHVTWANCEVWLGPIVNSTLSGETSIDAFWSANSSLSGKTLGNSCWSVNSSQSGQTPDNNGWLENSQRSGDFWQSLLNGELMDQWRGVSLLVVRPPNGSYACEERP